MYMQFYDQLLPCIFLLTTYFVFWVEIETWFRRIKQHAASTFLDEISAFEFSVTLLYSMFFTGLVTYINQRWIKNKLLGAGGVLLMMVSIIVLLLHGLEELNHLSMYHHTHSQTYYGVWDILIRYFLIGAAGILLALGHRSVQLFVSDRSAKIIYSVFTQVAILTILSFEYLNWAGLNQTGNEYKLGLSILWSVYALGLVILGINKKKKHWRLTGICFFIVTVIKLFLYDLSQTSTISKTISFISLGAILLLVSYLYNRYKDAILADDE